MPLDSAIIYVYDIARCSILTLVLFPNPEKHNNTMRKFSVED